MQSGKRAVRIRQVRRGGTTHRWEDRVSDTPDTMTFSLVGPNEQAVRLATQEQFLEDHEELNRRTAFVDQ